MLKLFQAANLDVIHFAHGLLVDGVEVFDLAAQASPVLDGQRGGLQRLASGRQFALDGRQVLIEDIEFGPTACQAHPPGASRQKVLFRVEGADVMVNPAASSNLKAVAVRAIDLQPLSAARLVGLAIRGGVGVTASSAIAFEYRYGGADPAIAMTKAEPFGRLAVFDG